MAIDLAQRRVLAFEERKRKYTMIVEPITQAMWLKYFSSITSTQEMIDGNVTSDYDSAGARLELLEAALVDASGYTPDGISITSVAGWKSKLPMAHRRAAADLLTAVERVPLPEDELPTLGVEIVALKATWSANESGRMQEITGLRHRFRPPTADHQKRYSRASSRSIVVGGSRTGRTIWLGSQDVLMELYDELVEGVEGYSVHDRELSDVAWVREHMDGYHKVAAAGALFTPLEVATT